MLRIPASQNLAEIIVLDDKRPTAKPTYAIPPATGALNTPAALEARRKQLESRLSAQDKLFEAAVPGGQESLAKLDHATENDRSYNDFSPKSFNWALTEVWPTNVGPELRGTLEARYKLQGEIESTRRAKIKLEYDPKDQPGMAEGVVWEVLGLFGLSRPRK
ncbi:MAG: hypothetical protein U1E65_08940 [Myxococcota bacterium]